MTEAGFTLVGVKVEKGAVTNTARRTRGRKLAPN